MLYIRGADMRVFLFLLILCLPVFASDTLSRINLNCLEFEFFPCDIKKPVIGLDYASLKKYTDTLIIIKHKDVKYYWRNKSVLFRGKENLGCYKFLCIRWNFGYQFLYSNY